MKKANPAYPAPLNSLLEAKPAIFKKIVASSKFSDRFCVSAIRSNAFSFSSDRTRIFNDPSSMERKVSSI